MSETEFKVGDRVRLTGGAWAGGPESRLRTGEVMPISAVDKYGYLRFKEYEDWCAEKGRDGFSWFVGPSNYAVEKVEEKSMFEGINVGDTVLVKYKSGVNLSGKTTKTYPRGEDIVVAGHFFVSSEEVESVTVLERAPQPLVPGLYTNRTNRARLLITGKGEGYYTHANGAWVEYSPGCSFPEEASAGRNGWRRDVKF